WISAFPVIAHLAASNRPYVMAYLHLVLIGTISLPLLAWYVEQRFFARISRIALVIFVSGFLLTEIILMLMPSATRLRLGGGVVPMAILLASVILTVGVILLLVSG